MSETWNKLYSVENTEQLWNMKSTEHVFLFSELVFLWLSTSQSVARQRVKIDRVLGVEDKFNMGVLWHESGVRFLKPSLANYGRYFHWTLLVTTELATIVAFGKRTPDQISPPPS